jgi:hypothetical protein
VTDGDEILCDLPPGTWRDRIQGGLNRHSLENLENLNVRHGRLIET